MVMNEFHEFEHPLLCILRYKSVTFFMECLLVRIAFMLTISKRKIAFTYILMYKLKKSVVTLIVINKS